MDTPHFRTALDKKRDHFQSTYGFKTDLTIFHDGPDTEARVSLTADNGMTFYGEGFAWLREGDHYDPTIGEDLAFTRAVIDALREAEHQIISQTVTEKQHAAKQRKQRDEQEAKARSKHSGYYPEDCPLCCGPFSKKADLFSDPYSVVGYGER